MLTYTTWSYKCHGLARISDIFGARASRAKCSRIMTHLIDPRNIIIIIILFSPIVVYYINVVTRRTWICKIMKYESSVALKWRLNCQFK